MNHETPDYFALASKLVRANETRGTGPAYDRWPVSLPQVSYVTADGGFLCVYCANGAHQSDASTIDVSDQWRIIGAQVNADDTPCDHCGRIIASQQR